MARTAEHGILFGVCPCSEQPSQNSSGQGESECLIKTKASEGVGAM